MLSWKKSVEIMKERFGKSKDESLGGGWIYDGDDDLTSHKVLVVLQSSKILLKFPLRWETFGPGWREYQLVLSVARERARIGGWTTLRMMLIES